MRRFFAPFLFAFALSAPAWGQEEPADNAFLQSLEALGRLLTAETVEEPVAPEPPAYQAPEERLADRLDRLAAAGDAETAAPLVTDIEALWRYSGSDTIGLLMDRGRAAAEAREWSVAARMYDHVNVLAPDFAEGWMATAQTSAELEDWTYALEALNNALIHEPRRYDAYAAIGFLFERAEEYAAALEAYETALGIHPNFEPALDGKARIEAARRGRAL
jgi:tetratricopeptide (TPR) repeat protein